MRTFFKQVIITLVAILIVSAITEGIDYGNNPFTLFTASAILAILNTFLKPLIKILTLPINVITLGFFGWFINVFILYLVTILVPAFDVIPFTLNLGNLSLTFSQFTAYLFLGLVINLVSRLVGKLT